MNGVFSMKNLIFMLFTSKIKFLFPFYKKIDESMNVLNEMMRRLIKESMEKIKNNGKSTSMLDFMIEAHLEGDMTEEELESNVFIFFAGHE